MAGLEELWDLPACQDVTASPACRARLASPVLRALMATWVVPRTPCPVPRAPCLVLVLAVRAVTPDAKRCPPLGHGARKEQGGVCGRVCVRKMDWCRAWHEHP